MCAVARIHLGEGFRQPGWSQIKFYRRDFEIMKVLVETSARHIHLSQEHLEILFGAGHELTVKKMLSQPGQYAAEEKVQVVGPKGSLKMSVLGPVRKETQVEVSLTDARSIGVAAMIRESGVIDGTNGCKLIGPCGEVDLEKGVIAAKRHIHMTPEDAEAAGLKDKDLVGLKIESPERSLIFGDVVVRVSASYATAAHIDTDEANALAPAGTVYGEIVKF